MISIYYQMSEFFGNKLMGKVRVPLKLNNAVSFMKVML